MILSDYFTQSIPFRPYSVGIASFYFCLVYVPSSPLAKMSKDPQIVQVSNPDPDADQVTRIPLDIGQYRVPIVIAAACIFTGAGLLPEILYIVLIKVAGLELWIGTRCALLRMERNSAGIC